MTLLGEGIAQEWNSDTRSLAFAQRVNIHRATLNPKVSPLAHNQRVLQVAADRCHKMINELWYGHRDLAGKTVYWDLVNAGMEWPTYWQSWGENIAWGVGEAEDAFQAFLASPSHKKNLESGEYNTQGAAFVYDPVGGIYKDTRDNTTHYFGPNWFICHIFMEVV